MHNVLVNTEYDQISKGKGFSTLVFDKTFLYCHLKIFSLAVNTEWKKNDLFDNKREHYWYPFKHYILILYKHFSFREIAQIWLWNTLMTRHCVMHQCPLVDKLCHVDTVSPSPRFGLTPLLQWISTRRSRLADRTVLHYCYLGSLLSQLSSTGGGSGAEIVLVLMSPMSTRASLRAWYILSISSLLWACSADSSIKLLWSPAKYR